MITSSPGFHLVTPSPTLHTTPEASEPPMWWPHWGWSPYSNTDTGFPSEAQTLLKLTPAAITRTITSNAPGSGTSISSSWKASLGSPSRSRRITQAAIVFGSSPGSTSSFETSDTSTATILLSVLRVVSRVPDWRAKTEPAEDAGSGAYLKSTRATEDEGWRRLAAVKRDRIYGTEHYRLETVGRRAHPTAAAAQERRSGTPVAARLRAHFGSGAPN